MAMTRRRLLVLGTQLSGGLVAAFLAVPIVGWALRPLFDTRRDVWRSIGRIGDLPVEQPVIMRVRFPPQPQSWSTTEDEWIVFVVRYRDGSIRTFSNICTHMQCGVRWQPSIGQFLCPCHGGLYSITGANLGGPPPRPLAQWVHRIEPDGTVMLMNQLDEDMP
jgi:quinol---cytochrome c reductase iron-sulfur subunit, bacillus type